jgi:hypothetical protein
VVDGADSDGGNQERIKAGKTLEGLCPFVVKSTGLLAVVGMQFPVRRASAAAFAAAFYGHLAETQPLDFAAAMARREIKAKYGTSDWAAPALYMQVGDGMIFEP